MLSASDRVRFALIHSKRWESVLNNISVITLAKAPVMCPEKWTPKERKLVELWAKGEIEDMPEPLIKYLEVVKQFII